MPRDPQPDPQPSSADDPADAAALRRHAEALAAGVERALGPWVERSVAAVAGRWHAPLVEELADAAHRAGVAAATEVGGSVRTLLLADVDDQRTNPLALVRAAVAYPTGILTAAGVPPVPRDEFAERTFPEDRYDLAPAAFADLDPSLHEVGLVWGAAKAHVVLARRRREGLR